jgi:hypothetical protein
MKSAVAGRYADDGECGGEGSLTWCLSLENGHFESSKRGRSTGQGTGQGAWIGKLLLGRGKHGPGVGCLWQDGPCTAMGNEGQSRSWEPQMLTELGGHGRLQLSLQPSCVRVVACPTAVNRLP